MEQDIKVAQIEHDLSVLAHKLLSEDTEYHHYSKSDLHNATIIFFHILTDLAYTENKTLPEEMLSKVGGEMGTRLRQLILDFTAVDTHDIVKENI